LWSEFDRVGEDIMSNATASKIVTALPMVFIRRGLCQNFSELKAYDGFVGAIAIDNKGNVHHLDTSQYGFASFDGDSFEVLTRS
jgi:L-asparaginase